MSRLQALFRILTNAVVDVAAYLHRRRAELLELAGVYAAVIAAGLVHPAAAWAVLAVALLAKSLEISRRQGRRDGP